MVYELTSREDAIQLLKRNSEFFYFCRIFEPYLDIHLKYIKLHWFTLKDSPVF